MTGSLNTPSAYVIDGGVEESWGNPSSAAVMAARPQAAWSPLPMKLE